MAPISCSRRHVLTRTLLGRGGSWCTSSSHAGRLSVCDIRNTIYVTVVTLSSRSNDLVASAHAPLLLQGSWFLVPGSWFEVQGSGFTVLGSRGRGRGDRGADRCVGRAGRCPAAHESLRRADRARPHRR